MGKTILYILILAILGFSVYYFIFRNDESNPYSNNEAGFTIKDTAMVGKIFISNNFNESILAERTDSGWIVNKQYKAFAGMVDVVLSTLAKQYALYPVTKSGFESAVKALSTDGIKVEVYDRKGNKIKVFYVGGAAVNDAGTNMMLEGAKTPYVVQEHGFVGVLTPRYNCDIIGWRDRTVFDVQPNNIKSISVQYFDKPEKSFTMSRDNGKVSVITAPDVKVVPDSINMVRVNYYMGYFTSVSCEGYLNGATDLAESITEKQKHAAIDVLDTKGKTTHTLIYWMLVNKRSKNQMTTNRDVPDDYDSDRMYAIINGGADTVLIQTLTFKKLLRSGIEFYQHEDPITARQPVPTIKKVPVR